MSLALHPTTEKLAKNYVNNPPHALLITGSYGVGASTLGHHIARQLSQNIMTVLPEKDEEIDLEKGIISIALIRRLYEQTRTTIDSRVIIIDYAERMAVPAQNAFLKLLEEPGTGTRFILISHEPQKLLPTVLSRVQRLDMQPVSKHQSLDLFEQHGITDPTKQSQLLYMASGLPAELTRLLEDPEYFEQSAQMVRDARELLQGTSYDRLLVANKYKDDRRRAMRLLEIAMTMLRQALTVKHDSQTTAKLSTLLQAYDFIAANGNIRLQIAHAVL